MTPEFKTDAKPSRGRPRGRSQQSRDTEQKLFRIALDQFKTRGFKEATLRDIAKEAGVSVGLLYRYFPNKQAILLRLYEDLTLTFVSKTQSLPQETWQVRFGIAMGTCLRVLGAERPLMVALLPTLVSHGEQGVLADATHSSRQRVQAVFRAVVCASRLPPQGETAAQLGDILYLVHLSVILFWCLDRSPNQEATEGLLKVLDSLLPAVGLAMKLPGARKGIHRVHHLLRAAQLN